MNKEYLEKLSLEELLKLKDDIEDRILELKQRKNLLCLNYTTILVRVLGERGLLR